MVAGQVLGAIIILAVLLFYIPRWKNRYQRNRPFPPQWQSILVANLPIYPALKHADKDKLHKLVNLFIASKQFVGCGGQEITDEIRVTIAAEACLLLLHQGWSVYPKLYSVLVYPSSFIVKRDQHREDGTVAMQQDHLSGESWSNGKVILSWDDVVAGVSNFDDGHNVVLHEFAHQLDTASGSANGAPPLRRNSYGSWAAVLTKEFKDLKWRKFKQHKSVMGEYGATNPAEFFAVATETFFEKPRQLNDKHPELFEELERYYGLDPRQWQITNRK
jgi:Mlc titration factor MtfA (ptsG expression regulator)